LVTTTAKATVAARENQQQLMAEGSYRPSFKIEEVGCLAVAIIPVIIFQKLLFRGGLLVLLHFHSLVVPFKPSEVRNFEGISEILCRPKMHFQLNLINWNWGLEILSLVISY